MIVSLKDFSRLSKVLNIRWITPDHLVKNEVTTREPDAGRFREHDERQGTTWDGPCLTRHVGSKTAKRE